MYASRSVQRNQKGLELSGAYQHIVYVDVVNMLGGSACNVKGNTEVFVADSKENGLEVNVDRTKYMVMFRDQNAGLSHSIRPDNCAFERVEEFKYWGTTFIIKSLTRKKLRAD